MAVYQTSFFYELDENGNSATGHVDTQIANGEADSAEVDGPAPGDVDDGTITVGEQFEVAFSDAAVNAQYGGTYTYIGHATPFSGFIAQDENGQYFMFSNDVIAVGTNLNGFVAEDIPLCFLAGTMIACPEGERAVETLGIGDSVLTPDGRAVPVKWLGRQTVAPPFGMPEGRRPVSIAAGALGENLPVRELRVTSDHALLLDGVLVQAGALVNGGAIRRIPMAELSGRFVAYHIETESHELVLAEGVPAETFIDNVTRRCFDNYCEYEAMFGGNGDAIEELPHPRAMSARQVPASIRAALGERGAILRQENRVAA